MIFFVTRHRGGGPGPDSCPSVTWPTVPDNRTRPACLSASVNGRRRELSGWEELLSLSMADMPLQSA